MTQTAGDSIAPTESLGDELARALDLAPVIRPTVNKQSREAQPQAQEPAEEPQEGLPPESEEIAPEEGTQEASEAAQAPETGGQEAGVTKFTDLVGLFEDGATPEDLYNLEIVSSDDGKVATVGDLKDHYQKRTEFDAERAEFDRVRQEETAKLEEARQQAQLQVNQIEQVPEELMNAKATMLALVQQAQGVDWKTLEEEDPGEAALTRQKYRDAYQAAEGQYDRLSAQVQQQRQQAYQQFVAKQQEAMYQKIPDWRDATRFDAERNAIKKLAAVYGYTDQDVEAIVDPRQAHLLRDFMLLQTRYDKADVQAKQVKERGNLVLRKSTLRPRKKDRIQQSTERARAPGATQADKHQAVKDLLQDSGFL
jgi:hypothetical protein